MEGMFESIEKNSKIYRKQVTIKKIVLMFTLYMSVSILCACSAENIFREDRNIVISDENSLKVDEVYNTINLENISFELPIYWKEEGSKTEYFQAYAEKGEKVTMLSVSYPIDEVDVVSFEALVADNDNMISAIESWTEDCKVTNHKVYESDYGVEGVIYSFDYIKSDDLNATGKCFCFPSTKDNRWFYVTLIFSDKAERNYEILYEDILASVRNTPNLDVLSASNNQDTGSSDVSDSIISSSSYKGSGGTVNVPQEEETTGNFVWVPVNGGTKYHSKSSCSKMKNPIQVSLETAEKNGYTPCKKCR